MSAQVLLDLAARYVRAEDAAETARAHGATPVETPDAVAAQFTEALDAYIDERIRS